MPRTIQPREIVRWLIYCGFTCCMGAAVFLAGGVDPSQWQWIAAGLSVASCLCFTVQSERFKALDHIWGLRVLGVLCLWMLFQLVPLPPRIVDFISPHRWNSASIARIATGYSSSTWLPLSVAPSLSLQRLVYVLPAIAAFVAAREMGMWWQGKRLWLLAAPVIVIGMLESLLGMAQFYSVSATSTTPLLVRGTYVNRNHFAGLLEMALPLAVMWAVSIWTKSSVHVQRPIGVALRASILLVISACILISVIASLSRMGFLATLAAVSAMAFLWLLAKRWGTGSRMPNWLWLLPILLPLGLVVFVSSNAMVLRFADSNELGEVTTNGRVLIWKETLHLIHAYPWTGVGLGAYEHALYAFRSFLPLKTIDFAHNDYLQVLAELGIVGVVLFIPFALWILWGPLSVIVRPYFRHDLSNRALAVGLLGSFVAIGLHALVDFNLYIPANALVLAWLAGIAASPALKGSLAGEN